MDQNEENLNEKFQKENNFQTSVRGLKVRGVFGTQEEAELKCKKLREVDPNQGYICRSCRNLDTLGSRCIQDRKNRIYGG